MNLKGIHCKHGKRKEITVLTVENYLDTPISIPYVIPNTSITLLI